MAANFVVSGLQSFVRQEQLSLIAERAMMVRKGCGWIVNSSGNEEKKRLKRAT